MWRLFWFGSIVTDYDKNRYSDTVIVILQLVDLYIPTLVDHFYKTVNVINANKRSLIGDSRIRNLTSVKPDLLYNDPHAK